MREHVLIMLNMIEYAYTYPNKQSTEYAEYGGAWHAAPPFQLGGGAGLKILEKSLLEGGGEGVRNFYFLGGGGCYIVGRRVNFFLGGRVGVIA